MKPFFFLCLMYPSFLLVSFTTLPAFAQQTWERNYGGISFDIGESVDQTADGGYIIAGWNWNPVRESEIYLVKTNAWGDSLWTHQYGGVLSDQGHEIKQTSDSGYIVVGRLQNPMTRELKVYLLKLDALGDTLWSKTFGDSIGQDGHSVQQTLDGGYIVVGGITRPGSNYYADVYLIKTDSRGDTLWSKTYGGAFTDGGYSVHQTSDGGYVIAGYTDPVGDGNYDVYLIRTDAQGDTLWTRTFGGAGGEVGYCVRQTRDSGFVIVGSTTSFGAGRADVYLIKTDTQGDTLWTRTYGDTFANFAFSVRQTQDQGYIIAGSTLLSPYQTDRDLYLLKTDVRGDTLWSKRYGSPMRLDQGESVQQTRDRGYIVAGYTDSFGNGDQVYLIKTDSLGNVGVMEPSKLPETKHLAFYTHPNPMRSRGEIEFSLPAPGTALLSVYDALGRKIRVFLDEEAKAGSHRVRWVASDVRGRPLSSGVYFLRLEAGGVSLTRKVVLLR